MEQVGTPMDLYDNPDDVFVAGFIGSPKMNFLFAQLTGRGPSGEAIVALPSLGGVTLAIPLRNPASSLPEKLVAGVRPECFHADPSGMGVAVSQRADAIELFGNVSFVHSYAEGRDDIVAEWRGPVRPAIGDVVFLWLDPSRCMLFDAAGPRL